MSTVAARCASLFAAQASTKPVPTEPPIQTNGTRIWRYAAGSDWQAPRNASAILRLYGSTEHYRQTFSSISNQPNFGDPTCSYRCGETPTRFSLVPLNELGAVAHWNQPVGAEFLFVAGGDVHDVRDLGSGADLRRDSRPVEPG